MKYKDYYATLGVARDERRITIAEVAGAARAARPSAAFHEPLTRINLPRRHPAKVG